MYGRRFLLILELGTSAKYSFFCSHKFFPFILFFSLLALHAKFNLRQFRYWYRHLGVFISSEQQEKEERERERCKLSRVFFNTLFIGDHLKCTEKNCLSQCFYFLSKMLPIFTKLKCLRFCFNVILLLISINSIITAQHQYTPSKN